MSVLASLYSGISGVIANGSALSVSGDNIANMNTIAFKSGNALFESSLTKRIGDVQVGLGSRLATTSSSFTQGAFSSSSRPTDLAIQGNGFFAVQNQDNSRFYTRAGSFTRDSEGNLVTTIGGYQLMGYRITQGTQGTIEEAINFRNISTSPVTSNEIALRCFKL
jgi:flagellar hook protein FlgE